MVAVVGQDLEQRPVLGTQRVPGTGHRVGHGQLARADLRVEAVLDPAGRPSQARGMADCGDPLADDLPPIEKQRRFTETLSRDCRIEDFRHKIRERLRHSLRQLPDGRWTYKFDPAIGSGGLEADFEQLWESVRQIRCPTLLVRGSESPILAAETAARFARELAGSEVAEVPGAGHSVMGDNPAGFVAAVRPFLARHGL